MEKDICGFEGLYTISDDGKVYSLLRNRYLNVCATKIGYVHVSLSRDGKRYEKYVHRLVAEAFLPNPDNKTDVNHIDGNKLNNTVENLEWSTHEENIAHRGVIGKTNNGWKSAKSLAKKYDEIVALVYEVSADINRDDPRYQLVNEILRIVEND